MNKAQAEKYFERKIGPYQEFIGSVAGKYVNDRRYVKDVTQEVLIKAWKHVHVLPEEQTHLKAWLGKVAKREAITCNRALAKHALTVAEYMQIEDGSYKEREFGAFAPAVCEDLVSDPFVVTAVKGFLEGLSCTHRDALLLSTAGLSYKQIARVTCSSLGTVRSRLHYARRKAQRALHGLV